MKKLILFLLLLPTFVDTDPLLLVVLMVKNEELVIQKTLQPFIDAGVNSFFIYDTGSTDKTIEVTEEFLSQNNADFCINQEPFVNFAFSRNLALDYAQHYFPNADFIVMPDAEWILHNVEQLVEFCKQEAEEPACYKNSSYLIRIIMNNKLDFYTPRLIRGNGTYSPRFVGAVHEVLCPATNKKVDSHVYFTFNPIPSGTEKTKKRWERDVTLLLEEHNENPKNSRTLFYLAQTYDCLGQLEMAHHYYAKRTELDGFKEENYMAWYRLAKVTQNLSAYNPDYTWEQALGYYLKAFTVHPNRAEPLIQIADYYWQQQNVHLCYLFARRATEIPYPKHDFLFIEKDMYDYWRWELLSYTAWHVGDFENGKKAAQKSLSVHPDFPHLWKNLKFYLEKS